MSQPDPQAALTATVAALSEQLAAHRGQLSALSRYAHDSHDELTGQFEELARTVTEALDAASPRGPAHPAGTTSTTTPTAGSSRGCASGSTRSSSPAISQEALTTWPTAGASTRTRCANSAPSPRSGAAPTTANAPTSPSRSNGMTGGCPAPCAASMPPPATARRATAQRRSGGFLHPGLHWPHAADRTDGQDFWRQRR